MKLNTNPQTKRFCLVACPVVLFCFFTNVSVSLHLFCARLQKIGRKSLTFLFRLADIDGPQQRPPQPPASPTIVLTVTEPKIQIAEVGSTVRFRCSSQSLVGRQVILKWDKESGSLPAGRAQDDRRGVLIITDIRHSDSGTYVCSGQDGISVVTETVVLNVGGRSLGRSYIHLLYYSNGPKPTDSPDCCVLFFIPYIVVATLCLFSPFSLTD